MGRKRKVTFGWGFNEEPGVIYGREGWIVELTVEHRQDGEQMELSYILFR